MEISEALQKMHVNEKMRFLQTLLEGAKDKARGLTDAAHTFLINPLYRRIAKMLGKQGKSTEVFEKFIGSSYKRSVLASVAGVEQQAVTGDPHIAEQQRQHEEDLANEKAVTDNLKAKVNQEMADAKKHSAARAAIELSASTRERDNEQAKADENWNTYNNVCRERGMQPNGEEVRCPSNLIYLAATGISGMVESAANYQAFLKAFPEDTISISVLSGGSALSILLMSKFCGSTLASFKNHKARKPMAIGLVGLSMLATITFSLLIGGVRSYGDPSNPLASHWSELAALSVNLFIFATMAAFSWSHATKREVSDAINPIIKSWKKHQKAAETHQARIDAILLSLVDSEEKIEADGRVEMEKAEKHVRAQGLEVAKKVGEHATLHAAIERQAAIGEAACEEAIWSVRLYHQLINKSKDGKEDQPKNLQIAIDPRVYTVPVFRMPDANPSFHHENSSNP
jgi:hypothetical protein